jgi:hypothetical protein
MFTLNEHQFSELADLCDHARYLLKHWQPMSDKPNDEGRLADGSEVRGSTSHSPHEFKPAGNGDRTRCPQNPLPRTGPLSLATFIRS